MIAPKTEAELSEYLAAVTEPVRIIGGGTRQSLGNPVLAAQKLCTKSFAEIMLFEPAALTLVVQAGTSVAEIQKTLLAENQRLPFEPMDHRTILGSHGSATIGGVVASNTSGPRRIQAGACRDSLIGVRFIDGAGKVVKNGGRVMKNVTGYDLVKLMAGSYGTLGVMTELSFKLQPVPETCTTIILHEPDEQNGIAALCKAMGSPNDVTGAAYIDGNAYIRIEGLNGSVAYRTEALKSMFASQEISIENDTHKNTQLWKSIADVAAFANTKTDIWRVSVRPTDGPKMVQHLRASGVSLKAQYDWCGGLVYLSVENDVNIREHLAGMQGHATLIRGNGGGAMALPQQNKIVSGIEAGLRNKFDPRGVLNTGIMG